jgi:hypothetical protein
MIIWVVMLTSFAMALAAGFMFGVEHKRKDTQPWLIGSGSISKTSRPTNAPLPNPFAEGKRLVPSSVKSWCRMVGGIHRQL